MYIDKARRKHSPRGVCTQIRLYPVDRQRLDRLVALGYGRNRSEVIRRLVELFDAWKVPAKDGYGR